MNIFWQGFWFGLGLTTAGLIVAAILIAMFFIVYNIINQQKGD